MHSTIQFEDRASRSRRKHEGESSAEVCDRPSRTREVSQRQLPTDHDHAVPTREYQLDQSSPLPATAAADPALEVQKQKPPHPCAPIDRVTPYHFSMAQSAAAVTKPTHLKAIAPLLTTDDLYDAAIHHGLLNSGFISAWLPAVGVMSQKPDDFWRGARIDLVRDILSIPAIMPGSSTSMARRSSAFSNM